MRILVTGASGFIGRNFLLSTPKDWTVVAIYNNSLDFVDFLTKNHLEHIQPLKLDLTKEDKIEILSKMEFDTCVFLTANGDPAVSVKRPLYDLQSNTATLVNLLQVLSFKKFIYFSSDAVYDGLKGIVSPESVINPKLPYAISKQASEQYIKHFQQQGRIEDAVIVRFFGAFGPYEPERKIYTKLVKQFGIERNPNFTIRGDGENLIDAMYIDDTIRAIHYLIKEPDINRTIDLYSDTPITLTYLVLIAAYVFNISPKIFYEGKVPEHIEFFSNDNFIVGKTGFIPQITLKDGLRKLYEHITRKSPM